MAAISVSLMQPLTDTEFWACNILLLQKIRLCAGIIPVTAMKAVFPAIRIAGHAQLHPPLEEVGAAEELHSQHIALGILKIRNRELTGN